MDQSTAFFAAFQPANNPMIMPGMPTMPHPRAASSPISPIRIFLSLVIVYRSTASFKSPFAFSVLVKATLMFPSIL